MAVLTPLSLNKKQVKDDLRAFKALLNDPKKQNLEERRDILPFFKAHPHLCAFMGMYNPNITDYKKINLACEFDIFGDHVADLVIGDVSNHAYCFIEFEDATETSVFKKTPKLTPEWSTRFEHGFSQMVDWILWLENNKGNTAFQTRFNARSIRYNMLLVIGRDKHIASHGLKERLDWRTEQVVVASKKFNCITFDGLYNDLLERSKGFR
jgi:Shedu protein SduA, C-terminal